MSRNSDATRVRDEAYMYVRLCRVASRVPCDPRPGAAALLVASFPRIPLLKRAHFVIFWRFIHEFLVLAPMVPTAQDIECSA